MEASGSQAEEQADAKDRNPHLIHRERGRARACIASPTKTEVAMSMMA